MGDRRGILMLLGAFVVAGCTGGGNQASPAAHATVAATPLPSAQMSQWLSFDAASKTATFTIVANVPGTESEFNYNGYTKGALVITVPKGWNVTVHCNGDPAATYAHSCTVVSGADSKTPAFPGASLPDPTGTGFVTAGEKKTFSFTPNATFVGRFACLLIGHESGGMWATFQVVDGAQPSLGTKP